MNSNDITIEEPCHENWDAMSGRGKQRFCGSCTKHVNNFSKMTRVEATNLLKTETRPCVRYSSDAKGEVQFLKPAPISKTPPAPVRKRRGKRAMLMAAAMFVATPAMATAVPAQETDPGLLEELLEQVRDWWAGEPEGFAGPGLTDPIPVGDTYADMPMMGMTVRVEPEEIPELSTTKGEVAPQLLPPVVVKQPIRMGKIARPIDE